MLLKAKTTLFISLIMILIFVLSNYISAHEIIIKTFSLSYKSFENNKIVFFTNIFLHANFLHMFMNLIALLQIGFILQKIISINRYLKLLFISSFFSSFLAYIYLFILNIYNLPDIYVLGSSGAIFGMYIYMSLIKKEMNSFYLNVIVFHAIVFMANLPIAWFSHLGGIIGGFIFYYIDIVIPHKRSLSKLVFRKKI